LGICSVIDDRYFLLLLCDHLPARLAKLVDDDFAAGLFAERRGGGTGYDHEAGVVELHLYVGGGFVD
jgi:hypothetical protein